MKGTSGASEAESGRAPREYAGITRVFALLGKRWTGMIVWSLLESPARFGELRRRVSGISERVLSDRLAELTEAGLVDREVRDGPPVAVVYRLTRRGEGLRPALLELCRWSETHLPERGEEKRE